MCIVFGVSTGQKLRVCTFDIASLCWQALCHRDMPLQGMLGNALGARGHLYRNTETVKLTSHVVRCSYTNIHRIISVNACLIGWHVKLRVTPVQLGICRRTGRAPFLHSR